MNGVARALAYCTALAALLGAHAVLAQTQSSGSDDVPTLTTPKIEVTGFRVPTLLNETSQGVSVMSEPEIRARNPDTIHQLFTQIPGVHIDQTGGPGGISSVYIRGSDPNHVLILVDGVRMNDPTNDRGGTYDLSSITPAMIERVEVIRGGGSAIYGADAMGGVINIITKRGKPGAPSVTLNGGLGTKGFANAGAGVSGGNDTATYSFGLSQLKDGREKDGGTLDLTSINGGLNVKLTENATWRFNGLFSSRGSDAFPQDSGGVRLSVLRDLERRHADEATLGTGLDWKLWERVTFRFGISTYNRIEDVNSPGVAPGLRSSTGLPASLSRTDFKRDGFLLSALIALPLRTALTVGFERLVESGDNQTTLDFGFPALAAFNLHRNTNSGFLELKSEPLDGLIVRLGARNDVISSSGQNVDPFTGDVRAVNSGLGARLSPSAGLRYTFASIGTSLKANYSEGYKAPSFYALSQPLVGNPDLKPETSKNAEVGVEQYLFEDSLWASLSAFKNETKNLVDFDGTVLPFGQLVNRNKVDTDGAEGQIRYAPVDALTLGLNATYARARIADTGARLRNRPDWRGGITIQYRLNEAIGFNWQTAYVGTTLDSSIPTDNVLLKPFWRSDFSTYYRFLDRYTITAAIDNVFNKRYEQFVGFQNPGVRFRLALTARF